MNELEGQISRLDVTKRGLADENSRLYMSLDEKDKNIQVNKSPTTRFEMDLNSIRIRFELDSNSIRTQFELDLNLIFVFKKTMK